MVEATQYSYANTEIESLILTYSKCKDKNQKHLLHLKIVEKCMPLVKKVACTLNTQDMGISPEDLIQIGSIGLIKAIDFYNPSKNTKFRTYVLYFIKGEIRHYLRDKGSMIKAPRDSQEMLFKIGMAIKKLNNEGIEEPTNEQIAEAMQMPIAKLNSMTGLDYVKSAISLDQIFPSDDEEVSLLDKIPAEDYRDHLQSYEDKMILSNALNKLPKELRLIIKLCFFEDYNQREIAEKLGYSQMQISRRMKKALSRLYDIITKQEKQDDKEIKDTTSYEQ